LLFYCKGYVLGVTGKQNKRERSIMS